MKKFLTVSFKIVFCWLIIGFVSAIIIPLLIKDVNLHNQIVGFIIIISAFVVPFIVIRNNRLNNPKINEIVTTDSSTLNSSIKEDSLFKRVLKIGIISVSCFIVLLIIISIIGYGKLKTDHINTLFGNKENYKEYLDLERKYDFAERTGEYQECLTIEDLSSKQFCLYLAFGKNNTIDICKKMDPDIHPSDSFLSQDACFRSVAELKDDDTICNLVKDKKLCEAALAQVRAQKKICAPLFLENSFVASPDCFDYAVKQKTKESCDGLIAAGGQNWKERCDIEAGLVDDNDLAIVPTSLNQCVMTKISKVGNNVSGNIYSGSAIEYLNGIRQFSREKIFHLDNSTPGDIVQVCFKGVGDCSIKNEKFKGNIYEVSNITKASGWMLSDVVDNCSSN
jgi:hypothetical protein